MGDVIGAALFAPYARIGKGLRRFPLRQGFQKRRALPTMFLLGHDLLLGGQGLDDRFKRHRGYGQGTQLAQPRLVYEPMLEKEETTQRNSLICGLRGQRMSLAGVFERMRQERRQKSAEGNERLTASHRGDTYLSRTCAANGTLVVTSSSFGRNRTE